MRETIAVSRKRIAEEKGRRAVFALPVIVRQIGKKAVVLIRILCCELLI